MQVRRPRAAILVLFSSGFLFTPVFGQTQRRACHLFPRRSGRRDRGPHHQHQAPGGRDQRIGRDVATPVDSRDVSVVRGLKSLPASTFRDQLYHPGLVETLLNGDREHHCQNAVKKLDLEKAWDASVHGG